MTKLLEDTNENENGTIKESCITEKLKATETPLGPAATTAGDKMRDDEGEATKNGQGAPKAMGVDVATSSPISDDQEEKKSECDVAALVMTLKTTPVLKTASPLKAAPKPVPKPAPLPISLTTPPSHRKPRLSVDPVKRWNEFYEKLKLQRETLGHTRVASTMDKQLYQWSYRQKRAYADKRLSEERLAKLDVLGFEWDSAPTKKLRPLLPELIPVPQKLVLAKHALVAGTPVQKMISSAVPGSHTSAAAQQKCLKQAPQVVKNAIYQTSPAKTIPSMKVVLTKASPNVPSDSPLQPPTTPSRPKVVARKTKQIVASKSQLIIKSKRRRRRPEPFHPSADDNCQSELCTLHDDVTKRQRYASSLKTMDNYVYYEDSIDVDESKPAPDYTPPTVSNSSFVCADANCSTEPLSTAVYTHQLRSLIQGLSSGELEVPRAVDQLRNMLSNGDAGDSSRDAGNERPSGDGTVYNY